MKKKKKLEKDKNKKEIKFDINDFKSDTIKIIIEKADTNELIKKYINNSNDIDDVNVDKNNIINEDNKIISQEKIIDIEEEKELEQKEKEKSPEEKKVKEKEQKGKEKIEMKVEQKIKINNNDNNISEKQNKENKENIEKNILDNLNDNINVFFLNKKRKKNLSIKEKNKEIILYDPIEMFITTILSRKRRFYNNETLLTDFQLKFLLTKIEKTIPEFRYLNLQIHTKIIFSYNISQLKNNNNGDNNEKIESTIIKDFYSKTKNHKNLIFIIKTRNNKSFGGFSESGFNQENNNNNCFIFSLDKMKMFDINEINENCVLCYSNKLPEFKNQIIFEENDLNVGYTGIKNSGFLTEEDYELNDGQKKFEINQIQIISLKGFN